MDNSELLYLIECHHSIVQLLCEGQWYYSVNSRKPKHLCTTNDCN